MNKILHISPWTICPGCNKPTDIDSVKFFKFFELGYSFCVTCKDIDPHKFIAHALKENFMNNQAYSILGANNCAFTILLVPKIQFALNLMEYGIPEKARILDVVYTPSSDGGLFPLEIHSNQPIRHVISNTLVIYPRELQEKVDKTTINILVTWINLSSLDDSYLWDSLLIAVENFVNKQYAQCILPSNIPIEAKLSSIINKYFNKHFGKKHDNSNYNECLNYFLPLIARNHKIRYLSDNIVEELNNLRKKRNDMGHRGKPEKTLSKHNMASYLSAAILGFHYLLYIEKKIESSTTRLAGGLRKPPNKGAMTTKPRLINYRSRDN